MSKTARIVLTAAEPIPEALTALALEQLHDLREQRDERAEWGHVVSALGEVNDLLRTRSLVRGAATRQGVDSAVVHGPLATRAPKLLMMDVDSTLITAEVIDEVAARAGTGEQVAAITERAMQGELDFAESLRARVATLAGLPVTVLDEVRESISFTPGALELIAAVQAAGGQVGLVSGGFTEVVEPLVAHLGINHVSANRFEVRDGQLTGLTRGEVVDRAAKRRHLLRCAELADCQADEVVAIGDGANDLDMLAEAGLGVAFCAKPVAATQGDATISFPRLDAVRAFLSLP
ncbi:MULTISPECIES: phosphoserine phosphatase SerB [unclassified Luteococcus]|uniref:phosphoserine phosphatase SerB n=1 Tax=unclassified Luteococcus TaxID=2639923 RepID=UPI00313C0C76